MLCVAYDVTRTGRFVSIYILNSQKKILVKIINCFFVLASRFSSLTLARNSPSLIKYLQIFFL